MPVNFQTEGSQNCGKEMASKLTLDAGILLITEEPFLVTELTRGKVLPSTVSSNPPEKEAVAETALSDILHKTSPSHIDLKSYAHVSSDINTCKDTHVHDKGLKFISILDGYTAILNFRSQGGSY